MSDIAADDDDDEVEHRSPLRHPSVKKMLTISATGVIGMVLAAWTWAEGNTKLVTKHETLLVGSGPTDPGLEQRVRTVEQLAAIGEAHRQEDHERLARMEQESREWRVRVEDSISKIADKVGAKK